MSSSEEEGQGSRRRSSRKPARYAGDDMSFSSGEESRSSSSDDDDEEEEEDVPLAESDGQQEEESDDEEEEEEEAPAKPQPQRRRLSNSRSTTGGRKNEKSSATRRSSRMAASSRKSYNEDKLDAELQDGLEEDEEEAEEDESDDQESTGGGSSSTKSRAKSTSNKQSVGSDHPGVIPLPEETKKLQIETILARRKKFKHRDTDAMERRHKLISAAADANEGADDDDNEATASGHVNNNNEENGVPSNKQKSKEDDADWEWEYLIKWKGFSYLHVSWETRDTLAEIDPSIDRRIDRWVKKMEGQMAAHGVDSSAASALGLNDDEDESEPFDPSYTTVERVLASNVPPGNDDPEALYLVKWMGLGYDECTWERGEDVADDGAIKAFRVRQELPPQNVWKPKPRPPPAKFKKLRSSPEYGLGKTEVPERKSVLKYETQDVPREPFQLRNYQLEGLNWLIFNWFNDRGSILADEMGLGKTAQILTFFHYLATHEDTKNYGPFLVVAPLSTIEHWARETKVWGDGILDSIIYHGRNTSREIIRHNEFFFADPDSLQAEPAFPKLVKSQPNNPNSLTAPVYKFNVLITTYEMAMADRPLLSQIPWQCIVVDEAHRLKNRSNRLYSDLQTFKRDHTILLTGTPIQNEIRELWALLHFLHPEGFPLSGFDGFLRNFGELKNSEQVQELHKVLRPYLLRRLKSDVDDTLKLPPKQETIVEVELTTVQKQYYRAIYERNTNFLLRGGSAANAPNLMNVMMELRKCCNHPFLVHGVEENLSEEQLAELQKQFQERLAKANSDREKSELKRAHARAQAKLLADQLVDTSGKMVLLDKLLPRFKKEGHRVLIFSQMVRMLDILQDYCTARRFGFERLDGRVRGPDRQKAIDRFSDPDEDVFVMLLSTRAGGLGINLTAADTVIIFDSDWNPQNDLQAQARAHRIGQKSSVKIYRLITRKTYEQHMFHQASLKLGLDQAVIGGMREGASSKQKQLGTKDVEGLLKRGAYDVFNEGEEGDKASQRFCEEDIDSILQRSTTVVWEGSDEGSSQKPAASNQFSKASFVTSSSGQEVDLDDPEFWTKQIGLDAPSGAEVVEELGGGLMMNARGQVVDEEGNVIADRSRRRKQVARYGGQEEEEKNTEEMQMELYDSDDSGAEYAVDDDDAQSVGDKTKDKRGVKIKAKGRKYGITEEELKIAMEGGSQNLGLEDKGGWNLRKMYQEEKRIGNSRWGNIESPWTAYERHKFHTAIWKYGWGRWHAIRLEGKLWKRTIPEIKVFARAYLQCAVHNARRALDLAAEASNSGSDQPEDSNSESKKANGTDSGDASQKTGAQRRNVFHVRLQNWMDRPLPGQRVIAEAEAMCPPVPKERIPSVLLEQEFQTRLDADSALKLLERFEELMRLRDLISIAAARYVRDRIRVRNGYSIRVDDYAGFREEQPEDSPPQEIDPPFGEEEYVYPSNREDVQHTDVINMPWPNSGQTEENAQSFDSWGGDDDLLFGKDSSDYVLNESTKLQLPQLKTLPVILSDDFGSPEEFEKQVQELLRKNHHVSQAIPADKLASQDEVPPHLACDELLIETVPRDELIKRIPIVPRSWFSADTSRPNVNWWKYPYDDGHLVLACYLDGFGKVDTLATDPRLYYCSLLYEEYKRLPEDKKLPKVPRVVLNAKGRQRTALMLQAAKGYLDPEKAHFQLPPPAPAGDEPDLREQVDVGMEVGEVPNEIRAAYLMISVQAINRHVRRLTHPVPNRGLTSRFLAKQLRQSFGGVYVPVTLMLLPMHLRPVVSMPKKSSSSSKEEVPSKKKDSGRASLVSAKSGGGRENETSGLRLDENVTVRVGNRGLSGRGHDDDTGGHDCLEGLGGHLRGPAPRGKASVKGNGVVEYFAPGKAPTSAYSHDKTLKHACEEAIKTELDKAWESADDVAVNESSDPELERLCQWVFLGSCGKQNDLSGTSLADYHCPSAAPEKSAAVVRQDWGKMEKRRLESALNRFGLPDERLYPLPASYEKVIRSFGIRNEEKRQTTPFFTWKDLVASAQLSKTPEVVYEYVLCSFLPHVMAIASGTGGAHLDMEESSTDHSRETKHGQQGDDEERRSVEYDDEEGEDRESVDEHFPNKASGKAGSSNDPRPRPSQYKRQYRGTRVLDPEIDLHLIGLTGRLFSRQLLTRISLIGGVRWILSHLDFDNSLALFLRCSSFRKHVSSVSMELHSSHSDSLLNSAYIVNSSSCSSSSENKQLPTWWCPWAHDVSLLRLIGQFGMNMGHSAGSFSRNKAATGDHDHDETDQSGSSVESSWGWVRSSDATHPLHPHQVEKHCWAIFFDEDTESSATAQTALKFMPPSDLHRLKVLKERLAGKYPTWELKKQYVQKLVSQWPSDSLIEARVMSLATHLSPFRSALPRVLGPVSRVTLPAQRQDVLSLESREEMLRSLWSEAVEEQWGWSEGDSWAFLADMSPTPVTLRSEMGWWHWGTRHAPSVFPAEEQWSAWGSVKGNSVDACLWGSAAGHLPSNVFVPKLLRNKDDAGTVVSAKRAKYLSRVFVDEPFEVNSKKRTASYTKSNPIQKAQKVTHDTHSPGSHGNECEHLINGASDTTLASNTQRGFRSFSCVSDPFLMLGSECARATSLCARRADTRVGKGSSRPMHSSLRVLNVLYDCSSGNPNAPPSWPPNQGHSWLGLGYGAKSRSKNANRKGNGFLPPNRFDFHVSWRGTAGSGRPFTVPPPDRNSTSVKNLSQCADIAVHLPTTLYSEYTKMKRQAYRSLRKAADRGLSDTTLSHGDLAGGAARTVADALSGKAREQQSIISAARTALSGENVSTTKRYCPEYDFIAKQSVELVCSKEGKQPKRVDKRIARGVAVAVWTLVQDVEERIEGKKSASEPCRRAADGESSEGEVSDDQSAASAPRSVKPVAGKKRRRQDVSLRELMNAGFIRSGKGVLHIKFRGSTFTADLDDEGNIVENGIKYPRPSSWSLLVKRRVVPEKQTDDGWYSIKFNGTPLIQLKHAYVDG